jgi:hypothetical protein
MALEIRPPLGDGELKAIQTALARAGLRLAEEPAAYAAGWRRAALREAVDDKSERVRYTPSPRRTRGATRA